MNISISGTFSLFSQPATIIKQLELEKQTIQEEEQLLWSNDIKIVNLRCEHFDTLRNDKWIVKVAKLLPVINDCARHVYLLMIEVKCTDRIGDQDIEINTENTHAKWKSLLGGRGYFRKEYCFQLQCSHELIRLSQNAKKRVVNTKHIINELLIKVTFRVN